MSNLFESILRKLETNKELEEIAGDETKDQETTQSPDSQSSQPEEPAEEAEEPTEEAEEELEDDYLAVTKQEYLDSLEEAFFRGAHVAIKLTQLMNQGKKGAKAIPQSLGENCGIEELRQFDLSLEDKLKYLVESKKAKDYFEAFNLLTNNK